MGWFKMKEKRDLISLLERKKKSLKELQNYNRKIFFCSLRRYVKTQTAFWSAPFHNKFTLWYIKLYTHRKINLLLISNIYLVFSSQETQRRFVQTKGYHNCFYSVLKETTHKPSKVATAKNLSSSVYFVSTCFDKCFLCQCMITGSYCFSRKFIDTLRFFSTAIFLFSLK